MRHKARPFEAFENRLAHTVAQTSEPSGVGGAQFVADAHSEQQFLKPIEAGMNGLMRIQHGSPGLHRSAATRMPCTNRPVFGAILRLRSNFRHLSVNNPQAAVIFAMVELLTSGLAPPAS